MKKTMTTIKIQKKMHHKMQQQIINDSYGMHGKSRWVIEAIKEFLKFPNYPELVYYATDTEQLTDIISIRLPEELILQIDQAIIAVRRVYPSMEGVRSNLIRASIVQRLIRSTASVTES